MSRNAIGRNTDDLYPSDLGRFNKAELVALCLNMLDARGEDDNTYPRESRYGWGDLLADGRTDPLKRHLSALAIALWLEQENWHDDESISSGDLTAMMNEYKWAIGEDDE